MDHQAHVLPPHAVLLHIGPHKTGTTAMQNMLATARSDLADHGVTYPGTRNAHHPEARVVRQLPAGWIHDRAPLPAIGLWNELVDEVRRTPGRVVISSEIFAQCNEEQRARVVRELGAERVYVLVAARNPASMALSTWQQVLRDGKTGHLETWLQKNFLRPTPVRVKSGFWSFADASSLVESWCTSVDRDRVRVVAVDEADRTLLPRTFERLLDLPSGLLAESEARHANRSLSAPEAELVRQVVEATTGRLRWKDFDTVVRLGMIRHLIQERTPAAGEQRATLPQWATDQAAHEADASIRGIRELEVAVLGDLDNLRPRPHEGDVPEPTEIPIPIAALAVTGAVLSAQRQAERAEAQAAKLRKLRRRVRMAEQRVGAPDTIPTKQLAAVLRRRVRPALSRRLRRTLPGHGRSGRHT